MSHTEYNSFDEAKLSIKYNTMAMYSIVNIRQIQMINGQFAASDMYGFINLIRQYWNRNQ